MRQEFQYENNQERESIISSHADLILIEEKNLITGNFITLVDNQELEEIQSAQLLKDRTSTILDYINFNSDSVTDIENTILTIEQNKIVNGGM